MGDEQLKKPDAEFSPAGIKRTATAGRMPLNLFLGKIHAEKVGMSGPDEDERAAGADPIIQTRSLKPPVGRKSAKAIFFSNEKNPPPAASILSRDKL